MSGHMAVYKRAVYRCHTMCLPIRREPLSPEDFSSLSLSTYGERSTITWGQCYGDLIGHHLNDQRSGQIKVRRLVDLRYRDLILLKFGKEVLETYDSDSGRKDLMLEMEAVKNYDSEQGM